THIPRIVLTGGPCAGKSTILSFIAQKVADKGYKSFIVPEVATEFIQRGIIPGETVSQAEFQKMVLPKIIREENVVKEIAEKDPHEKKLVICDRGRMDGQAYVSIAEYQKIHMSFGHNLVGLRDEPYDAVLHLRSTACGAEEFYTCDNNTARRETIEEASRLDARTLTAWLGHPHLRVIENRGDFDRKKRDTLNEVYSVLGIPQPVEIERKFLVRSYDFTALPEHVEVEILQYYLRTPFEERIRKRSQFGHSVYFHTEKRELSRGVRIEREKRISQEKYRELLYRIDHDFDPIQKSRICFVWEHQYFELDLFVSERDHALCLLEIELLRMGQEVRLPSFIDVDREVTDDPSYSNRELARKK
ncbi:AAA family ATPase, partial [Candidatus Parcubacteria bacterium]|nr:AAA family ATPase [Candidatus Parcubacteria bacterium]